jgi:hypothetical protein
LERDCNQALWMLATNSLVDAIRRRHNSTAAFAAATRYPCLATKVSSQHTQGDWPAALPPLTMRTLTPLLRRSTRARRSTRIAAAAKWLALAACRLQLTRGYASMTGPGQLRSGSIAVWPGPGLVTVPRPFRRSPRLVDSVGTALRIARRRSSARNCVSREVNARQTRSILAGSVA